MNQIVDDKSLKIFPYIFEKGEFKNKDFTAIMKIRCDSPTCQCSDILFLLKETNNFESNDYSFILDVINRKINKNIKSQTPDRDNAFAREFVANLTNELWMDFYNFFREYKEDLCDDYKTLKNIDVDFSEMEYSIEENNEMLGYKYLFPFSREIQCSIEGVEYLLDDQYCLASNCSCHNVGLSIIEFDKQDLKKPMVPSTILYDYTKEKWEVFDEIQPLSHSIENIILKLKSVYPDFLQILRSRHATFRSIYNNYRKKNHLITTPIQNRRKIGRNEPCPCGSGKKYKRCCG